MAEDFHKPAMFSSGQFEAFKAGEDPAEVMRAAHSTARALMARAREADDPAVIDRLVTYTDDHGIDAGRRETFAFPDRKACSDKLIALARPGDRIVIMGARDDTLAEFASDLLGRLAATT